MKFLDPLRVVTLAFLLSTASFLLAQDEEPASVDGSAPGLRASPPSIT